LSKGLTLLASCGGIVDNREGNRKHMPLKSLGGLRERIAVIAIIAGVTVAAPVAAESTKNHGLSGAHSGRIQYDWLRGADASGALRLLTVAQRRQFAANIALHGNGSYICSPAGSGKKSRCFAR